MRLALPFLSLLLIFAAAERTAAAEPGPAQLVYGDWQTLEAGIELRSVRRSTPPLVAYVIRASLKAPAVTAFVTPGNGAAPKDSAARSTTEALQEFACSVAINGSVFKPLPQQKGDPVDVLGLAISDGQRYSEPNQYHALLFPSGDKGVIAKPPFKTDGVQQALAGYRIILDRGKIIRSSKMRHPRTAVGLTSDGRVLYLAVVDGRLPHYSDGATLEEVAEILRRSGADSALNLDGGGSSTLVVRDRESGTRRINQPSGGFERRVANHLCIRTSPP